MLSKKIPTCPEEILDGRIFFERNTCFSGVFRFSPRIIWRLGAVVLSRVNKITFYMSRKFFWETFLKKNVFKKTLLDNNFFHRDFRILARNLWRLRHFFYRFFKIALYISGRTFSRKESFLSETFRYKKTLGSFGHLENLEEIWLFSEKKYFLTFFWTLAEVVSDIWQVSLCRFVTLALCLSRRTSSVKKVFFFEIVSIIVLSGAF